MATIGPVNLDIQPGDGVSDVTIDYTITFSTLDLAGPVVYRERVLLIGDDPLFDDDLIMLQNVLITSASPPVNRNIVTQVANGLLNEDIGRDEIFARVSLRDVGQQLPRVSRDSNIVTGNF